MSAGRVPEIFPSNLLMQNLAQNGAMSVWQRSGTTVSAIATSNYSADRFITYWNGSGAVINQSRQDLTRAERLIIGNGITNYFRWSQATAGTAATFHIVSQYMENLCRFLGKTVTLSFWAKADAARTVNTSFMKRYGTGGSADEDLTPITAHSLTTTWQRFSKTITISDDDLKTFGPDNTSALRFGFYLPLNVIQVIDITGVMVNPGSEVAPFSDAGPQEIVLLQRAFEKSYDVDVTPGALTQGGAAFTRPQFTTLGNTTDTRYKVTKRVTPTLTAYSPGSGTAGFVRDESTGVDKSANLAIISTSSFWWGQAGTIVSNDAISLHYTSDADFY